ncbi:MAG: DNA-binding transcriptional LysR family regulator [Phenylobacterium sp.]|jgi:DNA-binding transcriptional LysR family regulator
MANNDLNQIRIFSKVAQLQSFTKAAIALGIEKSTVSSKISQLESRLGIRLLQRTTRSVSLTEAGSQYLSYCEQALAALQMGDDYIADLSQTPAGRLRVSTPHNLVDFLMPTVITPFLQRYPQVSLEMVESSEIVDLIKDNFDIAMRTSSQQIPDSSLIYRKIYQAEMVLVASRQHIEQYGVAQNPQQLVAQPSVGVINENSDGQSQFFVHWKEQKVALKYRFAVNNMNSIKQAIKADLGFGIVSKNMIRQELAQGQLIEVSSDIRIRPTALYVVYPSRSGQPAKSKAFVDAMMQWGRGNER